jgi:hypothetical protein
MQEAVNPEKSANFPRRLRCLRPTESSFDFREVADVRKVLEILILSPESGFVAEGGGVDDGVREREPALRSEISGFNSQDRVKVCITIATESASEMLRRRRTILRTSRMASMPEE